jgi:hypothetical protein
MMSLAMFSLAGSLFAVATPTATYRYSAAHASQPVQVAHLTRQWVADGRGQVWRPEIASTRGSQEPALPAPTRQAHTFLSVGR